MASFLLRIAVLIAAVVQIAFPLFVNPFRDGQDAVRAGEASQIEPAEYAFAIWGPIYLLALIYALWQLTPRGRADPTTAQIAPYTIALYAGSSLWLSAAQWGPLWATMPTLAAMAVCAAVALLYALRGGGGWRMWTIVTPFGLYAGWTLCATFVNIAEVAPQYGFDRFGLSIPVFGALSLACATAIAAWMLWRTQGELSYAAALLWALIAIIIAGRTRGADDIVLTTAGVSVVVVAVLAFACKLWGRSTTATAGADGRAAPLR
ncbi:MAG: hypothetical protein GC206_11070 [Alphaproteobacteria bacterium]|nr:hypothetical protein [Alphaproteobacteria bacterium]